jgi:ATP-dependent Clp protease ATP-binding subunit ClpC
MEVTDNAKVLIAKKGFDPVFGARPLRRAVQNMIEDRIAEEMLDGNVKAGDNILVDAVGDEIVIKTLVSKE